MLPWQRAPVWSLGQGTRIPRAIQHDKTKMENNFTGSVIPLKIKYKSCSSMFKILYNLAPTFFFNLHSSISPPELPGPTRTLYLLSRPCPGNLCIYSLVPLAWNSLSLSQYIFECPHGTDWRPGAWKRTICWLMTDTIFVLKKLKV